MPTPDNIKAPITIFGHGRSGTSLTMDLVGRHSDVDAVGETGPLLFDIWASLAHALPNCKAKHHSYGESIQQLFLRELGSEKSRWIHKPIQVPASIIQWISRLGLESGCHRYWTIFEQTFPLSTSLCVVRAVPDVIASSVERWRLRPNEAAISLLTMQEVLKKAPRPLPVVSLDRLLDDKEAGARAILSHCGLSWEDQVLECFGMLHVPNSPQAHKDVQSLAEAGSKHFRHVDRDAIIREVDEHLMNSLLENHELLLEHALI